MSKLSHGIACDENGKKMRCREVNTFDIRPGSGLIASQCTARFNVDDDASAMKIRNEKNKLEQIQTIPIYSHETREKM